MSTVTLPKGLANFETSLAANMSAAATSLTLNRSTDDDGTTLSGLYELTIDEGTSSEEHMYVTLAGAAGTVSRRGLSRVDAWTEQSGNKFAHDRGASVKITNISLILITRLLNGDDTFNSVDWLGVNSISGLATPGAGETTKAANVAYVNAVAIAGANDAAENQKGIVELATAAESQAGTDTGSTSAYLMTRPSHIAANTQNQQHVYAADTGAADAYEITLTPAVSAYATGQRFCFLATNANTGASTLDVNGLGAKTILKANDQALEANDIEAGHIIDVIYNGTQFEMQTPTASQLTTAIATETTNFFSTTDITGAEAETLTDGSNADSLHTHYSTDLVENNINSGTTVDIVASGFHDFIEAKTGAAVVNHDVFFTALGSATNGDDSIIYKHLGEAIGSLTEVEWDNTFEFIFDVELASITNQDIFIGLYNTTLAAIPANATDTTAHAGFYIADGTIYASQADGATQETSDVSSGLTLTDYNTMRIVFTGGTDTKFYINDTLVATLNTNQPTGATPPYLILGITTLENAAKYIALRNTWIAKLTI